MSGKEMVGSTGRQNTNRVAAILGAVIMIVNSWIIVTDFHGFNLINLTLTTVVWVQSQLSMFRVTLIAGFGSLLSIPFLRKRARNRKGLGERLVPTVLPRPKVHPLVLTPRPSRDAHFVIKKRRRGVGLRGIELEKGFQRHFKTDQYSGSKLRFETI